MEQNNHEVNQGEILKERLSKTETQVTEGTRENATDGPMGNGTFTDQNSNGVDPVAVSEKDDFGITRGSGAVIADTCYDKRVEPTKSES